MNLTTTRWGGVTVVSLSGTVGREQAGPLLDGLVAAVQGSQGSVVLDLAELEQISRAAVRGIVVAARLLHTAGRRMRICNAHGSVELSLQLLGYAHLLHLDATLPDALLTLSEGGRPGRTLGTPLRTAQSANVPIPPLAATGTR